MIIGSCETTKDGVQEMDTRDIVAATLAGAVLQTLVPAGGGGVSDTVAEAADTQEATIQLAVLLYQKVLQALPPETP